MSFKTLSLLTIASMLLGFFLPKNSPFFGTFDQVLAHWPTNGSGWLAFCVEKTAENWLTFIPTPTAQSDSQTPYPCFGQVLAVCNVVWSPAIYRPDSLKLGKDRYCHKRPVATTIPFPAHCWVLYFSLSNLPARIFRVHSYMLLPVSAWILWLPSYICNPNQSQSSARHSFSRLSYIVHLKYYKGSFSSR